MKSNKVLLISKIMNTIGINNIGLLLHKLRHGNNYIRAINYHSTPEKFMSQFEKQLKYFSRRYYSVTEEDLSDFLNGRWNKDKPGLIISFDDGLESNYKYAKPLLEKYNFSGWFFIPTGLIGTGYCEKDHLTGEASEKYMDWSQVDDLIKNHVVGSHTVTHKRLSKKLDKSILKFEIKHSKKVLDERLNSDIDIFCWVGGETDSYSQEAQTIIKESGYKFSFLTNHYPIIKNNNPLHLERTNVEANWPLYLVKFYISAFMDLKYLKKRRKIKELLK